MEREELAELIEQNGTAVYSFCCHLTSDKQLADDLYQDTFLKAWELCDRMERGGNPKSYIMGIAVKLWQNQKRKQANRHKKVPLEEYYDNVLVESVSGYENMPEQEMIRKEQQEMVRRIVNDLPEKMQMILYLFYTVELSLQEMAEILHIPVGTVKSRLNKGRKQVKKRMEVYWDGREED